MLALKIPESATSFDTMPIGVLNWLLDSLPFALLFVSELLVIVASNQRGRELVTDSACLSASRERLVGEKLEEIRALVKEGHSGVIALKGSKRAIEVQVVPLPIDRRANGVCSVLVLRDLARAPQIKAQELKSLYRLTPAEVRLTLLLMDGKTLKEAARSLDVCLDSVRSQLKSVFAKTNTKRQAELVLLLSGRWMQLSTG